jgi:hypothetical protein
MWAAEAGLGQKPEPSGLGSNRRILTIKNIPSNDQSINRMRFELVQKPSKKAIMFIASG